MGKARVIVTYKCPRTCELCSNKKFTPAPPIDHWNYEQIILTGGEPLLFVDEVKALIGRIRKESKGMIILYTAIMDGFMDILPYVDGICLTLHDPEAVDEFNYFVAKNHAKLLASGKSLRVNVFREAGEGKEVLTLGVFKAKTIEWTPIEECTVPEGETLFELPELL